MRSTRARLLIVLFIVMSALGVAMSRVGPVETLDKKLWYSPQAAAALLDEMGPAGRLRYRDNELIDLMFLASYTAFAFIAMAWIWERRPGSALRRWRLAALLPGLLDLAETSLVLRALADYPGDLAWRLGWLCALTPTKWFVVGVMILFALYGAVMPVPKTRVRPPLPGSNGPS